MAVDPRSIGEETYSGQKITDAPTWIGELQSHSASPFVPPWRSELTAQWSESLGWGWRGVDKRANGRAEAEGGREGSVKRS